MPFIVVDIYHGLADFITAPARLLRLHNQCLVHAQKNYKKNNTGLREKQAERRMQLQMVYEDVNIDSRNNNEKEFEDRNVSSTSRGVNCSQRSAGLLKPLLFMWGFNATLCGCIALILSINPINNFVNELYSRKIFGLLGMVFSAFCKLLLLVITETVTFKILDQIATFSASMPIDNISKKKPSSTSISHSSIPLPLIVNQFALSASMNSAIGGSIVDRIYAMWRFLLMVFGAGSKWKILLYAFSQSLLYSCYAFEYLWRTMSGNTFEKFLTSILNQWPYFVGYGGVTGILLALIPDTFGWSGLVLSLSYPLLVVGALSVSWNPANLRPPEPYLPLAILRLPVLFSTYPALYATNILMNMCARFVRKLASRRRIRSASTSSKSSTNKENKRYFQESDTDFARTWTNDRRSGSIFSALNSGSGQ